MAGLVLLMVVGCLAVVWLMMHALRGGRPHTANPRRPVNDLGAESGLLDRFPSPHLQVDPHRDLEAWRSREEAELNHYGWIDRSNGVVRLPIARAMALLLERGLPGSRTVVESNVNSGVEPTQEKPHPHTTALSDGDAQ